MSENLPKGGEHFIAPKGAEHEAAHHKSAPEHEPRHEAHEQAPIAELQHKAEKEAIVGVDPIGHESAAPTPSELHVSRELHQQTWQRTMVRVRKHLSAPDKTLSKIIHQPAVDAISRVGEKTVARPSGLLTGGIFAFVGSSFFLYMSKHYGFRYNYLLFVMFFVGGFFVGLILELLASAVMRKKAH